MPQQSNGYDCGLYALAMARALCTWAAQGDDVAGQEAQLRQWLTPSYVTGLRAEILDLVRARAGAPAPGAPG